MNEKLVLLLPILFPVIAGVILLISKLEDRQKRQKYVSFVPNFLKRINSLFH